MAPDTRLFATLLSFVRTMLNPFHRDGVSESSSQTSRSSKEGMPVSTWPRPSTPRRNRTRTPSRPAPPSSKGKKGNEMEDLLREFGPKEFRESESPGLCPQRTEATPLPEPSTVPIPNQNRDPEERTRPSSLFGLRRNSGTDSRDSHSPVSGGHASHPSVPMGSRDPVERAIAERQKLDSSAPKRSTDETCTNNIRHESDRRIIRHRPSKPKLTYARMSKQSQEDVDVRRQGASRHAERDQSNKREMREIESLRKQLSEAADHARQAERAAHDLRNQVQRLINECEAKHIPRGTGNGNDPLQGAVDHLKRENQALKAELDDAKSHIFSLQPYRQDLTPEQVGTKFDELMSNVADWVTRFVEQVQDDPARVEELLAMARKKPSEFLKLRKVIEDHPDLSNGCLFPETDIDIFIAVVTRFLNDNIFQKILCGIVPKYVDVISSLEMSMQSNVEPKRDIFSIRTWRAETLNAVICGADYQKNRDARVKDLTYQLAGIFKPFRKEKEIGNFYQSCQDEIILPAVAMQEALSTSTHHFYIDLNPYAIFNTRQEVEISPDLIESLSNLRCENILLNRKPFTLAKLQPAPTADELRQNLVNVATLMPALYMRQVGKGDSLKPPRVVRPQQMLVAWGSQQQREKYLNSNQSTLITQIYCAATTKERQLEAASSWPKLPWS